MRGREVSAFGVSWLVRSHLEIVQPLPDLPVGSCFRESRVPQAGRLGGGSSRRDARGCFWGRDLGVLGAGAGAAGSDGPEAGEAEGH